MRLRLFILEVYAAFALSIGLPAASTEAGPIFMGLGDLPGGIVLSRASAVSADGTTVVGTSSSESGAEAFRWTIENGMIGLGDLPGGGFSSEAFDVSGDGTVIVGTGQTTIGATRQGFRWENGVMTDLGGVASGWATVFPSGVSRNGAIIVGGGGSANGFEAFRWTQPNGFIGLGDLSGGDFQSQANAVSADGSVVVGVSQTGNGDGEAFVWTAKSGMAGLGFLPGGGNASSAMAVSADGSVIAGGSDAAQDSSAFLWTTETGMVPLGTFAPRAFSDDSSIIVGMQVIDSTTQYATYWDADTGLHILQDMLENDFGLELGVWQLTDATDISADGLVIVGRGTNPFGQREAWIAVIPEPTTLVLLAAGAWLIPRRRYRLTA